MTFVSFIHHFTYTITLQDAAQQGAQLVVLPEMWSCPYRNDAFPEYAEPVGVDGRDGPAGRLMAEVRVSMTDMQ